jgi:histidinol phosphatase-like enzyme
MKTDEAEKYRRMIKAVEIHKKIIKLIAELTEIGYEFISYNNMNGIKKVEE